MEHVTTIRAKLVIAGRDWNPTECTRALGIAPTRIWSQTRQALRDRRDLETDAWIISGPKLVTLEINPSVDAVVDVVWPKRSILTKFVATRGLTVKAVCSVEMFDERPELELSLTTLIRLSEIHASVAIDLFVLSRDEDLAGHSDCD